MPPTLDDALLLAIKAHRGQVDKAGEPYILHVLRVVVRQRTEVTRIVAALHDMVEDTAVTLEDLERGGYNTDVREAVDCLSRREGEPYESTIARIAGNPIARLVKLADLEDNMDPRRMGHDDVALRRMERYRAARETLGGVAE